VPQAQRCGILYARRAGVCDLHGQGMRGRAQAQRARVLPHEQGHRRGYLCNSGKQATAIEIIIVQSISDRANSLHAAGKSGQAPMSCRRLDVCPSLALFVGFELCAAIPSAKLGQPFAPSCTSATAVAVTLVFVSVAILASQSSP
jgi:hypothetical protein